MSSTMTEKENSAPRPPPLLFLGAARTGTASLMEALRILGLENVHHGWEVSEREDQQWQWRIFDRAADATFPNIPTYNGKGFSRAEWDEVFGSYEAVSDVASFFAESLIPAYPDAKVILVERDIEKWYKSVLMIFEPAQSAFYRNLGETVGKWAGYDNAKASFKMHQGWTKAPTPETTVEHLKEAYIGHNKYIRENVPADQLLDFQLSQGWEPLCRFLGKPIPDVPFPHANDSAAYKARGKKLTRKMMGRAARNFFFPCFQKKF
ncbi:hypothetical protein FPOA_06812 [Fusarium poae]|uniref:P-loop containing nucleoside triphosphate hydrolase protein n=1 Tax=Fusarium poae TaxID=36050 RepID=A0A1B8AIP7_FUSPO|nr:hypothetical protein FPOA_06812 [Fusarium poae]